VYLHKIINWFCKGEKQISLNVLRVHTRYTTGRYNTDSYITIYYTPIYRVNYFVINKHNETRWNVIRRLTNTNCSEMLIIQSYNSLHSWKRGALPHHPNRTDYVLQIFEFKENTALFNLFVLLQLSRIRRKPYLLIYWYVEKNIGIGTIAITHISVISNNIIRYKFLIWPLPLKFGLYLQPEITRTVRSVLQ